MEWICTLLIDDCPLFFLLTFCVSSIALKQPSKLRHCAIKCHAMLSIFAKICVRGTINESRRLFVLDGCRKGLLMRETCAHR